jgi:hypothetical protein
LLLAAMLVLARQLLRYPASRVVCLGAVALHPYVIDFGALARGYTLGLGFALLGLASTVRAARSATGRGMLAWLAIAGVCGGAAIGPVLLFVNLVWAGLFAANVLFARQRSPQQLALALTAVILPAVAVLVATYARMLGQLRPDRLQFGAPDLTTSLASLFRSRSTPARGGHVPSPRMPPWGSRFRSVDLRC